MDYRLITECGNREVNEDYVVAETSGNINCFVLCDGLGGHSMGDVSSEIVASSLTNFFKEHSETDKDIVSEGLEKAQKELLDKQIELNLRDDMKTTAVVLLTDENSAIWAHIGDSRLYLFHKNKIVLRTLDHSVPQMLALAGDIKESKIRKHPERNSLLRVMGAEWNARKYEISDRVSLDKCQAFLLCSDGFWEYITEKKMCRFLKKCRNANEWMNFMLEEVRKNAVGEVMDNYSAIAVII